MTPPLFITGASGFVGVHLLHRIREAGLSDVTCLTRRPEALARRSPLSPGWRYVEGALDDPEQLRTVVPMGATVLHLAAATGAAPAREHQRVNVAGTRALIEACRAQRVARLIFVSSIAAKFSDQRHYPYARSKKVAEELVATSGLTHLIVRPTVVFGEGSPALTGLRRLAVGKVGVVVGSGRVRVQPIDVRDLARILLALALDANVASHGTVEVGGPEVVPMNELLRRVRHAGTGQSGPFVHLPAGLLREAIATLGWALGGRLPVSAGQLASFVNDGDAEDHESLDHFRPDLQPLDSMLRTQAERATV